MAIVEIYTTDSCSYCWRAKELLKQKGVSYREIRVDQSEKAREEMLARTGGRRQVPQVFINHQLIGGFADLWALDQAKKLDDLLSLPPPDSDSKKS